MDLFTIITILICISAIFSYLNERFLKLPGTIGVVTIPVMVSILILIAGKTSKGIAATIILLADSKIVKLFVRLVEKLVNRNIKNPEM